jgi:hypothetical protein
MKIILDQNNKWILDKFQIWFEILKVKIFELKNDHQRSYLRKNGAIILSRSKKYLINLRSTFVIYEFMNLLVYWLIN